MISTMQEHMFDFEDVDFDEVEAYDGVGIDLGLSADLETTISELCTILDELERSIEDTAFEKLVMLKGVQDEWTPKLNDVFEMEAVS